MKERSQHRPQEEPRWMIDPTRIPPSYSYTGTEGPADGLVRLADDLRKLAEDLYEDRQVVDSEHGTSPQAVEHRNTREQEAAERTLTEWGLLP